MQASSNTVMCASGLVMKRGECHQTSSGRGTSVSFRIAHIFCLPNELATAQKSGARDRA